MQNKKPLVHLVIPARFAAERFPGKPLAKILDKPMIQWVVEGARNSKVIDDLFVATEDDRIREVCESFGAKVIMTSKNARSGTERVFEASEKTGADIYINVQGDEPLMEPHVVEAALRPVLEGHAEMSTVSTDLHHESDLLDPNVVKVITDQNQNAIYFSRHPIPYTRKRFSDFSKPLCRQHVGIYVYKRETLKNFIQHPVTEMEQAESLEQLRAMVMGVKIRVEPVKFQSIGVDVPSDISKVEKILRERK